MLDMTDKYELTNMHINELKEVDKITLCLDVAFGKNIDKSMIKNIENIVYHMLLLAEKCGATYETIRDISNKKPKRGIKHLVKFDNVDSIIEFILQVDVNITIGNIITLVRTSENSYNTYETLTVNDGKLSSEYGCDEVTLRNCQDVLDRILAVEGLISLSEKE